MSQILSNIHGRLREQMVLLTIIILFAAVMSFASPYFLRVSNFVNIVQYVSVYGITAIGMTMVILTGGINLSVGGTLALSAWVCAFSMLNGVPWPVACLICLGIGGAVGAINGLAVAKIGIPPLIATLALEQITRGLQLVFSKGKPLYGFPEPFLDFGAGRVLGAIPMSVVWTLLLFLVFSWFLARTIFGRTVYAVGGNPVATRIAGINNSKIIILVYVMAGLFASFAGLILISRMDSAPAAIAQGLDMQAITACVIGGGQRDLRRERAAGGHFPRDYPDGTHSELARPSERLCLLPDVRSGRDHIHSRVRGRFPQLGQNTRLTPDIALQEQGCMSTWAARGLLPWSNCH